MGMGGPLPWAPCQRMNRGWCTFRDIFRDSIDGGEELGWWCLGRHLQNEKGDDTGSMSRGHQ